MSAAGRHPQSRAIANTLSNTGRQAAVRCPALEKETLTPNDMKAPNPEDYSTDEEYLEAQDAYEAAVLLQEERAMENYYENKYR